MNPEIDLARPSIVSQPYAKLRSLGELCRIESAQSRYEATCAREQIVGKLDHE